MRNQFCERQHEQLTLYSTAKPGHCTKVNLPTVCNVGLHEEKMIINKLEHRCEDRQSNKNLRFKNCWLIRTDDFIFFPSTPFFRLSSYSCGGLLIKKRILSSKADNSYLWNKKNDFHFQLGSRKLKVKSPLMPTISLHRSHRDYSPSEISNFFLAFILSLLLYSANNQRKNTLN